MDDSSPTSPRTRTWYLDGGDLTRWVVTVEPGQRRPGLACACCRRALTGDADVAVLRDLARVPGWEAAGTTPLCLPCVCDLGRYPVLWGRYLAGATSGLSAPAGAPQGPQRARQHPSGAVAETPRAVAP